MRDRLRGGLARGDVEAGASSALVEHVVGRVVVVARAARARDLHTAVYLYMYMYMYMYMYISGCGIQRVYAQSPQGDKVVRTGCRVTIGYSHSHYDQ